MLNTYTTLCLPQTTPHTITTSHTNGKPSLIIPPFLPPHSFSNNYHYDHQIPPFITTNQPQSLRHNIPNNQYLKGSTPTQLELTTLGMAILATLVTLVKDPLVQRLTTLPLYLSIRGFQVHKHDTCTDDTKHVHTWSVCTRLVYRPR